MKASLLSLPGLIAVGLAGCATPDSSEKEMRPQEVRTGMSPAQVDRLMGAPKRSCWSYERAGNVDSYRICFAKGVVDQVETRKPIPGTKDFDIAWQWGTPDHPPSPTATTPGLGMDAAQVGRLMGKASMWEAFYYRGPAEGAGSNEHYAFFRNGGVVKFGAVEYRCVHALCTRTTPSETGEDGS